MDFNSQGRACFTCEYHFSPRTGFIVCDHLPVTFRPEYSSRIDPSKSVIIFPFQSTLWTLMASSSLFPQTLAAEAHCHVVPVLWALCRHGLPRAMLN